MFKPKIIGIIGGRGKMGSYFARIFKSAKYKVLISGRTTKLTNKELALKSDVVIVSVFIEKSSEIIREIAPYVKKNALFTDFTSLKSESVKEMLKSKADVIGCHPLFGPTNTMENQVVVLCPVRTSKEKLEWLKSFFLEHGAIIKIITPLEHDRLMSAVQGLSHFTDITHAYTLKKLGIPIKKLLSLSSPSYFLKLNLMGRIFAQDPRLYGSIQLNNPFNEKVLEKYMEVCKQLIKINKSKNLEKFEKFFLEGAKYLGNYKNTAFKETDWLISVLNRHKEVKEKRKTGQPDNRTTGQPAIAVLGPENTYSDLAAKKYFKSQSKLYCKAINEVFEAVKKEKAELGLVPVENRLSGTILETLDNLFLNNLKIREAVILPIHHSLCALNKISLKRIRAVISGSQPLSQCSRFIKKNLPSAKLIAVSSSSEAMHKIIEEHLPSSAVIGDNESAKALGLTVLKRDIDNDRNNKTTFLVIAKNVKSLPKNENLKTSIAFYFSFDAPGALFSVLKVFADAKINLTKIESRPTVKRFGDYIFYLDFKGGLNDDKVKKALKEVNKLTAKMKIFGSYEKKED